MDAFLPASRQALYEYMSVFINSPGAYLIMSMHRSSKLEVSSGYKDRLQTLLQRAFGRIPEETSYSHAGRCLGLSHSSIKSWVEGSLKWEIHPTSVHNLAEILQKPVERVDGYLRYGSSLEVDRDNNSTQITLADIKEIITRRNYRPTPEDSLYLAEISSAIGNLILETEISRLRNQRNSSTEQTYGTVVEASSQGAEEKTCFQSEVHERLGRPQTTTPYLNAPPTQDSRLSSLPSNSHKVVPFASIKAITSYLQSKINPGKYQDFFRACPLVDNYSADLIEVIFSGKTEILPLETVELVIPAIAQGLGVCLNSQKTLFLKELKILLND